MNDVTVSGTARPISQNLMALLAFCVASLVVIAPILHNAYLPLVDLPNHIARHYIATAPAGPLDAYYDYTISLVPNAAVDFAWIAFGGGMDAAQFTQLSLVFYCISFIFSTMLLSRVLHGGWSPWPVAVALVCYNGCFFWGFQNYIVSVPFAIFGLTLWLWCEKFGVARRIAILAPVVFVLYLMHFFAFAILAVAAFGREIQRLLAAKQDWKAQLGPSLLLALPFVIPLGWLVFDIFTGPASPAGSYTSFGELFRRIEVFQSPVDGVTQALPVFLRLTGFAILLLLGVLALQRVGKLDIAPQMRGPLIALAAFALVMPMNLNGVAYVHIRFPFVIVALFFAATQWRNLPLRHAKAIAVVIVTLLVVRSVSFDRYAALHSGEVEDFIAIIADVPEGERLFPVMDVLNAPEVRLWHLAAYAVPYRDVFVPTLFQGVHSLVLKDQWSDYASPGLHTVPVAYLTRDWGTNPVHPLLNFIKDWDRKYTYLVLIDPIADQLDAFPQLTRISTQGRFTLYKITPTQ